ncbi:hypothetical protein SAMN05428957_105230 [Oryzisolibacter propanilivorax]|uniref:PXPV repeat-containing protein n=1 Tax=Oryzisolibacter propanilivorax TaxID=1527607 RepID=A0A1G9SZ34_9BURK|nr:hypothetical protein [Oryzisolibacter propanilivorax]SDM40652.1 hypothetical protein SAMN05428957_105230 [Oryzisolibacter propanilivorax]
MIATRTWITSAGVALALLAGAGAAQARSDVQWSIGVGVPGVVVGASAPGYYTPPAPVYYTPPPPVYYRPPAPVYYAPPPVYYRPPAPVYVAPRPYYGGGYYHHHHHRYGGRDWR